MPPALSTLTSDQVAVHAATLVRRDRWRRTAFAKHESKGLEVLKYEYPCIRKRSLQTHCRHATDDECGRLGKPSLDLLELAECRLSVAVDQAQRDRSRADLLSCGRDVAGRQVWSEVDRPPSFARSHGECQHRAKLVKFSRQCGNNDSRRVRRRVVRHRYPSEHPTCDLRGEVLVRWRDFAAMPPFADRPKEPRERFVNEHGGAEGQRTTPKHLLEAHAVERIGRAQSVAEQRVDRRRDRLLAWRGRRLGEESLERFTIQPRDLTNRVASTRRSLEQNQPLDVVSRVEPLTAGRTRRVYGAVSSLPGSKRVGAETGLTDHSTKGVPRRIDRWLSHDPTLTALSTYGQCYCAEEYGRRPCSSAS